MEETVAQVYKSISKGRVTGNGFRKWIQKWGQRKWGQESTFDIFLFE